MILAEKTPTTYGRPTPGRPYYDMDGLYKMDWFFTGWRIVSRHNNRTILTGPACLELSDALDFRPYAPDIHEWDDDAEIVQKENEYYNSISWLTPDAEKYLVSEETDYCERRAITLGEVGGYAESIPAIAPRMLRRVPFTEL